jgi:hypothetical protein
VVLVVVVVVVVVRGTHGVVMANRPEITIENTKQKHAY